MSEETAEAPVKRRRRRRAAVQAPQLPITATVHIKGRKHPLVLDCFEARNLTAGWQFRAPAETNGRVRTITVSHDQVLYVEVERWSQDIEEPRTQLFQPLQAIETPAARGPQEYVANPFAQGRNGSLPQQGRPSLSSLSTEAFVPDASLSGG